jgi:hypothetical protein
MNSRHDQDAIGKNFMEPRLYSPDCLEGKFCELRIMGILGSCARPCNPLILTFVDQLGGANHLVSRPLGNEATGEPTNYQPLFRRSG